MNIMNRGAIVGALTIAFGFVLPLTALAASPAAVNLGTAGNYAILAKTGVSTTGTTAIVGDIGVSPAAATYVTGFSLILPNAGAYSTSALITGKAYASDYAAPTPTNLTAAVLDMQTAYTDAASRAPNFTELGAGTITDITLAPGVYKWSTSVTIPTDITLSGSANDVWIFQIAQNLNISSAAKIVLAGGARASNIFWQVAGQTTIGTTAVMNGNILDQTAIVLNTGATLNGRALAQSAVTLDANAVTAPTSAAAVVTVTQPAQTTSQATATTSAAPAQQSTTSAASAAPASSTSASTQTQSATPASGLTTLQIQAILDVLASFNADASTIANVRTSLGGTTTGSVTSAAVHIFKTNLTVGSLGSEVKALQEFLNAHGYPVAVSGAGSPGNETTRFGAATKAALIKYQAANGIKPASGYFGAITQGRVNAGQ